MGFTPLKWLADKFTGSSGTAVSFWPPPRPNRQRSERRLRKLLTGRKRSIAEIITQAEDNGWHVQGAEFLNSRMIRLLLSNDVKIRALFIDLREIEASEELQDYVNRRLNREE